MKEMKDKIQLVVQRRRPSDDRRCVQISGEADAVLMSLCRATGLPIGKIVSQMIIQGAELVEIIEED